MDFNNIKSSIEYTVCYFNLLVFSCKNSFFTTVNFANMCYHNLVITKALVYILPVQSSTHLHVLKKHTKRTCKEKKRYFKTKEFA